MVEGIALITQTLVILGLLAFIAYRETKHAELFLRFQTLLTSLPTEMQKFYTELDAKRDTKAKSLFDKTFSSYLKHIRELEKMVLPKPVTEKMVREVLAKTPLVVENDIDKDEDETIRNFGDIPFNEETQVLIEGVNDEIPTQVI